MKFKTTAIAMAVAGIVAAPVAVQAGADELYASARVGVINTTAPSTSKTYTAPAVLNDDGSITTTSTSSTESQNQTQIKSFASRFGAKGETDLGNGLTGFGRYEWGVDFNGGGSITNRHRYVGLKGDFGSVLVGQTYQTFYNFVVGPTDIPWWHSGSAMVEYRGRTDNALTYAGGTGAINFGATIYLVSDPEEEDVDATEVGISFGIGDMTLGLAASTTETTQGSYMSDDAVYAAALTGISFGDVSLGFGVQSQKDDWSALAEVDIGNIYVHVESLSIDDSSGSAIGGDSRDVISFTVGYTQSLGRKTTAYYEINNQDNDTGDSDDDYTAVMAVLKYDII